MYAVYDANWDLLGYGTVNQQALPDQFTDQGVGWGRVGTFKLTTGSVLRVILWNSSGDGQVCADAVRITPVGAITVDNASQGTSTFSGQGGWSTQSTGLYGSSLVSTSTAGSSHSMAIWSATVQPGRYDLAVTWTSGSNLSADATYAVYDVNWTLLGYGVMDQQVAPHQFTEQGVIWDRLGTFNLTTGSVLRVILWNSAGDGQVCADAVRIEPATIIDNTDAGFSNQGGWTASGQGLYGSSLISSSTPGSNASAAFWTASLAAGNYDFAATWTASSSLSSSAVFAIYDANWKLLGYGTVNQQTAPNGFSDQGVGWVNVGTNIHVTGGLVHVALYDSSTTGNVCADAIRIQSA
jgi:hypothetical protein